MPNTLQPGAAQFEFGSLKLQAQAVVVFQFHQPEFALGSLGTKGQREEKKDGGFHVAAHGQVQEEP
ncbi:hypothetical protein AE1304_21720 [Aeromonas enteropelogenes]